MTARFEIDVLTKFRSVGLSQIAQEARTALSQVASQKGLSSAERVTRANQTRTGAEQAIQDVGNRDLAAVRAKGLTGNALAQAEAAVRTEQTKARQGVTRLFNEINGATTDLGKRLAKAVKDSGVPIMTSTREAQAALTAASGAGGAGRPPVPPPGTSAPKPGDDPNERAKRLKQLQARETAARQQLAADSQYIDSKAEQRKATQEATRKTFEQLKGDDDYIKSMADTTIARRQAHAKAREMAVGDERLKRANLDLARASAQESAERFRRIAGDRPTIVARAEGGIQQQRIRAAEQSIVAADPRAYRAQQVLARAQTQQAAGVAAILAGDSRYTRAQQQLVRAKTQQQANLAQALAGDSAYTRAQQQLARGKAQQQSNLQQALAGDRAYTSAQQGVARGKAQQQANLQQALAADRQYLNAQERVASAKAQQQALIQQGLAGDSTYLRAQALTARAKSQQQATIQQQLASDGAYARAQQSIARSKATQQATLQQALASDNQYIRAQAVISRSKALQAASVQEALASDNAYTQAQARTTAAKARQAASVAQALAGDTAYAQSQARLTRSKTQQQANVAEVLAGDNAYTRAQQQLARGKAQQQANLQQALAADGRYNSAQQAIARAKAQQQAGLQQGLASDGAYARAQQSIARSKAVQQATLQQALGADATYARAQQSIARSKATQQATLQQALASDNQYLRAQATVARSKALQAASIQEALASDRQYGAAQARLAAAKARQAASTAIALGADQQYIASQVATARGKALQQAGIAEGRAADTAYISAQARITSAKAQQTAKIQAALAADTSYVAATGQAAAARAALAARTAAAELGITGAATRPISDLRVATALQQKIDADLQAAGVTRARAAAERTQSSALARASAERRAAERLLNSAIHANARAEVRQAIAAGEGTRFQRMQARYQAGGSNRLPSEFQTGGSFIGSRALTTFGYGLAGAAMYGSVRAIGEMVREAEELDRVLNQVEAQLQAVGSGAQFEGARQGILRIARETGSAADEVASVQFQFQGAFGALESGGIDATKALIETEAAMKVVAVTGLSMKEVLDSLTATARTFRVGVEEIGDVALGVQERFGVLATETITFVADLAPVAASIGLSLEDLASLGGVAQQVSGRAGSALAEGFGRILPQIQELRAEILEIYNLPNLQGNRTEILEGFASGNTGVVFQRLVRDYNSLSKAQQNFVVDMLGGRREAQVLIPILENASLLTADWNRNLNGLNAASGKTDQYFERLQKTVSNTSKRFGEAVRQIGEGLFRAGFADAFISITNAAASLADVVTVLVNGFGALNNMFDGGLVRLLAYYGLFRLLRATLGATSRSTADVVVGNQRQAQSYQQVTVAATASAKAVTADSIADRINYATSVQAAQGNLAQAGAQNSARGLPYAGGRVGGQPMPIPVGGPMPGMQANSAYGLPYAGTGVVSRFRNSRIWNFGRSYSGFIGLALAMEGVNQYYKNAAEEVQKIEELQAELAKEFEETEDLDRTLAEQQKRADELRNAGRDQPGITQRDAFDMGLDYNEGIKGGGILGRAVNYIGGTALNAVGQDGDRILRTAAGQQQDYEVIEAEVTKERARQYTEVIESVFASSDRGMERLVTALKRADLTALEETIANNLEFATPETIEAFSPGGSTDLFKLAEDLKDGGLVDREDITDESIQVLLQQAAEGDRVAAEMLRLIGDYIQDNPLLADLLELGTQNELEDAARDAVGGEGNYQLRNIETARGQFDAGLISLGEFIEEQKSARADIADAIATARRIGESPLIADLIALAEADKGIAEDAARGIQSRIDALATVVDLQGANTGGTAALDQQIALVKQFLNSGAGTQEQRFAQIPELIGLLRQKFERDLEDIADEAERARQEALGFELPASIQATFVEQQLVDDPAISSMLQTFADVAGLSLENVMVDVAHALVTTEKSLVEITREMIQEQIDNLVALVERLTAAGVNAGMTVTNAIGVLQRMADDLPAEGTFNDPIRLGDRGYASGGGDDGRKAEEEAARAARARAEAQINLQRAYAQGDPVRLAQLDIQSARIARQYAEDDAGRINAEADRVRAFMALAEAQQDINRARLELWAAQVSQDPVSNAQAQLVLARQAVAQATGIADWYRAQIQVVQAQRAVEEAHEDIVRAQYELLAARVQRDPVRSAQAQVALAYIAIAQADGTAARIRAQIQMVNAQASLLQAQQDVAYAWLEGVISYFTIIGDSVRAAQLALQLAQRQLRDIVADPASGAAERQRAKTAVIEAEAAVRNAKYDDQLGDIEYMLELEKISVAQAIQMLQRMAEIPGITEEQLRTIERRIRSLREEVSGDLAFNLPDIQLPTLYEVRRLMQSGQPEGAGAYQDNRAVTIQSITIATDVDAREFLDELAAVVGAPPTTGIYPSLY